MKAITYVGNTTTYSTKIKNKEYEFEWQKSIGIGNRFGEIRPEDATSLLKRRDSRGRKIFRVDK
jgi:hypothetical protein